MIFDEGIIKPVMFFNRPDIYHALHAQPEATFTCAVSVVENHWNGRTTVELRGHDILFEQ
jgi:hypothetical protein